MYVMNNPTKWEDYLHLTEFPYNNKYQTSSKMSPFNDLGHAKVHDGDNSQLNESSTVMAKAYKKNQQSKKHTKSTGNIHTDNMQEFEPIYYLSSMKMEELDDDQKDIYIT